jgi:hypothetical protein
VSLDYLGACNLPTSARGQSRVPEDLLSGKADRLCRIVGEKISLKRDSKAGNCNVEDQNQNGQNKKKEYWNNISLTQKSGGKRKQENSI